MFYPMRDETVSYQTGTFLSTNAHASFVRACAVATGSTHFFTTQRKELVEGVATTAQDSLKLGTSSLNQAGT